jgi:hypothetical protein
MYKKIKIPGVPEWAEIGTRVKRNNKTNGTLFGVRDCLRAVVLFDSENDPEEVSWIFLSPLESWEPKQGDFVAAWDNSIVCFGHYHLRRTCSGYPWLVKMAGENVGWKHIARVPDGLILSPEIMTVEWWEKNGEQPEVEG